MSALADVWRRFRVEVWLTVAAASTNRALNLCRMPEDEPTIRAIYETTGIWIKSHAERTHAFQAGPPPKGQRA